MEGKMKSQNLILIFSVTLLLAIKIYPQATVEIPFTVEDSHGNSRSLIFGLDLTATSGIDSHLGEQQIPNPAPGGGFDARFISMIGQAQLGDGTLKDIRNAPSFPFYGTYSHRVNFQPGGPLWDQQTITVSWNLPPQIVAGSTITLLGGSPVPFVGIGSIIAPAPVSDNDRVTFVVVYNDILPVELTSFSASIYGQRVLLNWTTASEINNQGFAVERTWLRSSNYAEASWETIGFVPGFGTTTEPKSYSFVDENISSGIYKYRLKQIDFDGTFTYSNETEVEVDFTPKEFVLYQNYPNPFNPNTVVSYQLPVTGNVTLKIYDILGNEVATLVNEEKQPGVYEVEFNPESSSKYPASGVYFYQLKAGNYSRIKKMVLLR